MNNDFEFIENTLDTYSQDSISHLINWPDSTSDSNGLFVMHNNRVVIEHYHHASAHTLWDFQSVTKSFGASLLLLALDRGLLTLDETVCETRWKRRRQTTHLIP